MSGKFLAKVALTDLQSTTLQIGPEETALDVKQRVVQKHAAAADLNIAEYELACEGVSLADELVLSTKFSGQQNVHLVLQKRGEKVLGEQIEEWSTRKEKATQQLASPECTGEAKKLAEQDLELSRKQLPELVSKALSTIGPHHLAGYLVKQRTMPSVKWQQRFFTFNEGCMCYRDNPNDKPKMEVCLRGARIEQTSSYVYVEEKKYTRIVLQVDSNSLELGAMEEQVEHWVRKIAANIALVTPIEFEVGEQCSAPWSDRNYYLAEIVSFGPDKSVSVTFPEYGESFVCQKSELRKLAVEGEQKTVAPLAQREVVKKDSFLRIHKGGKWTSKHFRLIGFGAMQSLQYFKDVASLKSLGTINITATTTVECVNGGELYSFHVIEKDQPPHLLCAASEALRAEWLHAIAAIVKASVFGAMSWGLSLLVLYPPEELGKKELEAILDEAKMSKEGTREEMMSRVRELKRSPELVKLIDVSWNSVESTVKPSAPARESSLATIKVKEQKDYVKKEGILLKKGAVNTKQKPRYFRLTGHGNTQSLQYFKKKEEKAPLGTITVCAQTTVQLESGVDFTVTPNDKRAYELSASSEQEAKEWVAAIQKVINATTPGAMSWSSALLVLFPAEDLTEKELIAILEEAGMSGNENLNKDQLVCKVAIMQIELNQAEEPIPVARTSTKASPPASTETPRARPPPKGPSDANSATLKSPRAPPKITAEVAAIPFRLPAAGGPLQFRLPPGGPAGGAGGAPPTGPPKMPPKPAPPGGAKPPTATLPSPLAAPPQKQPQAPPRATPPLPNSSASLPQPLVVPKAPPPQYKVGQKCFAPWTDGHVYSCTILAIEGDQVEVNFDEYGEAGSTTLSKLSRKPPQ